MQDKARERPSAAASLPRQGTVQARSMSEPSASSARPSHSTHATGRSKLVGHLAMLVWAALIAGSFSLGAQAVPHIGPAPLNAVRFIIGAAIIGAFAVVYTGKPLRLPKAPWRFAILGALMGTYFVTMFISLSLTKPVSTSAVFTLTPLFTAGFAFLLMRQVSKPVVLVSLTLAGAGSVWVIFGGSLEAILAFAIGPGELVFFIGVIGHALYATLLRKFDRGEPALIVTFWTVAGIAACITLYGLPGIVATDWLSLPSIVWIALAYLIVFATVPTFFLVTFGVQRLPSAKVMAYGYLTPSIVILIEGLAGHGWAGWAVIAGALVTVLGLVVLYFSPD
jgi:drug/metabolite transporter (DMT)-like permease